MLILSVILHNSIKGIPNAPQWSKYTYENLNTIKYRKKLTVKKTKLISS